MKVTCKKCGKIFDYDTYMGICPGCAAYYSMSCSCNNDLNEELLHDKYSKSVEREYRKEKGESTHKYFDTDSVKEVFKQFADGAKGNADKRYDERSGEKNDKSSRSSNSNRSSSRTAGKSKNSMPGVAKAIIIFIVIGNFGLPILGGIFSVIGSIVDSGTVSFEDGIINFIDEELEEDYFEDGYYDEEYDSSYENGYRDIYYQSDEESSYIRLYNMTYETEFSEYLADGMEIVSFYYEVYDAWDEMIEPSEEMVMNTSPYVLLDNGVFQGPEDAVFISKLMEQAGYDSEYIGNAGISNNISCPEGKIYFCVRQDSVQAIQIDIIDEEGVIQGYYFDNIW